MQNFLRTENCSVVAVCDRLGELARDVAGAHSIPQHFDSVKALIQGAEFDAWSGLLEVL